MSQQIQITGGAKVRNLEGVLTGTAGVVNALGINVPSGIPQLDGSGKILVSQLPNSVMEYKGTWNAATNTPTLVNGTGNQGDVYLCNVAGTVNFGAGAITFAVGDQAIYSGTIWQKAGGSTGTVTSVAVTETGDALTITGSPITTSGTINIGFAGTSGQYVNGAGGLTTFPSLAGYVTAVTGTAPVVSSGGTTPAISMPVATASVDGYLDNADWTIFNNKQNAITLTTTGTSGAATLVGATLNIPNYSTDLSGYVPYTGATTNVNLGTFDLTADLITGATGSFASSGGSDTFAINHSSGSGIALNITKGGAGEGLYINKTSGSGNAATIIGTLNATTLVKSGGTSTEFLKADGSVDSSTYLTTSSAASTYVPYTGATANVNIGNNLISSASIQLNGDNTSNFGYLGFKQFSSGSSGNTGYTSIYAQSTNKLGISYSQSGGGLKTAVFSSDLIPLNSALIYRLPASGGDLALTSDLSAYLPLTGGTLSGALNINLGSGTGLNVSTENVVFRSSPTYGSPRQLVFSMGSGPTTTLEAKGYGANYITDFNIITHNASGTAFNVFFGTAQGDVGIGNTSPAAKLDVSGTGRFTGSLTADRVLTANNINNSTLVAGSIEIQSYSINNSWVGDNIYFNGSGFVARNTGYTSQIYFEGDGDMAFKTSPSTVSAGSASNVETRMTIKSGGNVGIGTSSPTAILETLSSYGYSIIARSTNNAMPISVVSSLGSVSTIGFKGTTSTNEYNVRVGADGDDFIAYTSNTERMRITSGGNVGIGTTAASSGRLVVTSVNNTSGIYAAIFADSSGADLLLVRGDGAIFTGTRTNSPYNLSTTGRSAVIESTGALGYLVSTRESKTNIESIKSVDFINKLNPVQFNYRKKDNINNVFTDEIYDNINYGFIADEVELVNKELVFYKEDGSLAGVEYNNMIAILTKAVQELEARIKQLENK